MRFKKLQEILKRFNFGRFWKFTKWVSLIILGLMIVSHLVVGFSFQNYIYSSVDSLPVRDVGLLLGTSKYIKGGKLNPYYQFRIDAAVELIRKGKIKYLIVSGDNRKVQYNEPRQMRADLMKHGVAPEVIFLDYAGFRTLDSIIRAKKVFGQNRFIVISQPFHNQRAVFIARCRQIDAIAYNAQDVSFFRGLKVQFRELFARVKLMIDLFVINKQPKFLGEQIKVGN